MPPNEASLRIRLLAYIWSTVGLGTSIAALWFIWLFPSYARKPEAIVRPKTTPATPKRPLPPIRPITNRHISFELSLPDPIPILPSSPSQESITRPCSDTSSSSTASSCDSALTSPNTPNSSMDRFHTPRPPRRLPTLLKSFSKRKNSCESETECDPVRRKSTGGFSPLWSKSRSRSSMGEDDKPRGVSIIRRDSPLPEPSVKGAKPLMAYFGRASRRQSVPVPPRRTEPYGAPYFALPPTVKGTHSRHGSESAESRPSRPRQTLLLPGGRRPITKRRSASTSRAMTSMQL